jgi:quinol-cytochrome oxidoreductase complex cytochrome b subunit
MPELLDILLRKIDNRLNLAALFKVLRETRPKGYISPLDAPPISPGRIALFLLILLVLSGLGLTLYYDPTAERAASSLAYLHREQPLGWLVHNTHRWSALLLFVFVILHALRVWLTKAYRFPRDINWWGGIFLLLLIIFMGGTGYLLRWDIKAFTLMDLIISNFSKVPVAGPLLVTAILGGSELDVVPLYRGYALHVWFLPFVVILVVIGHLLVAWRQGLADLSPAWREFSRRFPVQRWQHLAPGMGLLIALLILSAITPHSGESGPSDLSAWPHPDWLLLLYFLPFWYLKGVASVVVGLIILTVMLTSLLLAPRLGRKNARPALFVTLSILGVAGIVWLFSQITYMGYQVPLQGCSSCHRPTIVGDAPIKLSEFKIRDPDWLVFHLKDPQGSLLVPFASPEQAP